MKKPSLIIGKKQIIMTCLTLMLAVAVYINYAASPDIMKKEKEVLSESELHPLIQ